MSTQRLTEGNRALATNVPPAVRGDSILRSAAAFALLALELGLFLIVLYKFNLQSRAFLNLGILTFFAFSIHYFLPSRWRLSFFVLVSWLGILLVFGLREGQWSGSGLVQGLWIIGLGLLITGICYLPISAGHRIGLVALFGGVLAAGRAGWIAVPWSDAIWPVLASLFMFRLVIYLFYLRHAKERFSPSETLAYFFLLPNVCFPLFPVVDFQTLRRTYYDREDRSEIYQRGIHWMFRGVTHLLAYRLIYHHWEIDGLQVQDMGTLLHYFVWPWLLYLRISGQFHMIVGMLHLFGFRLPATNHLFYLTSSFTDFWRRANIYWKDFMMRVVYYPAFFKLRKTGPTAGLVLATTVVFVVTWLLHSYQWFWIRGKALFAWNDIIFWAVLGTLVTVNVVIESKRGRVRVLEGGALPVKDRLVRAIRTPVTFLTICFMWSFWSADSIEDWTSVVRAGVSGGSEGFFPLLLLIFLVLGTGSWIAAGPLGERQPGFRGSVMTVLITAVLLITLSFPQAWKALPEGARPYFRTLQTSELNSRDYALLEKGYYENLLAVDRFNPELWEIYLTRPTNWVRLRQTDAVQWTGALPHYELVPSKATPYNNIVIHTNSMGMRDKEYPAERPEGAFRGVIVGSSWVMGSGVEQEKDFESLLEDRLNAEPLASFETYEILNLGVAGYTPLDHVAVVEGKALDLDAQVVFVDGHLGDIDRALNGLVEAVSRQVELPAGLRAILERAGIETWAATVQSEMLRDLQPYGSDVLSFVYKDIVERCLERGVLPVWFYFPRPEQDEIAIALEDLEEARIATEAGFLILDGSGVWDGQDLPSLWVAEFDHHPNDEGSRLIANRLYEILSESADSIFVEPAIGVDSLPTTTSQE